ncbi:MAG: hypothetical protein ACYC8T_29160 [Myxococcaceae bacterium]
MRRAHVLLLAVLAVLAAACGAPQAGDSCSDNGFLCADALSAMECKKSKTGDGAMWMKLPCRGPAGCQRSNDIIKCDMTMNNAGDACASTAEGKGLCNSTATATLECREGTLVQTNSCRTCSVSGEQIICQ